MPARFIEIELPIPPSINHYYKYCNGRVFISRAGLAYRNVVRNALSGLGVKPIEGPVEMSIDVFMPDNRRRDLDNLEKSLIDALQHGGAFADDFQIVDKRITRCGIVDKGMIIVRLTS